MKRIILFLILYGSDSSFLTKRTKTECDWDAERSLSGWEAQTEPIRANNRYLSSALKWAVMWAEQKAEFQGSVFHIFFQDWTGVYKAWLFKSSSTRLPSASQRFLASIIFLSWRRRQNVPPKRRAFSEIHGVTTQTTVLFSSHWSSFS